VIGFTSSDLDAVNLSALGIRIPKGHRLALFMHAPIQGGLWLDRSRQLHRQRWWMARECRRAVEFL